jgi:hypothetical protein
MTGNDNDRSLIVETLPVALTSLPCLSEVEVRRMNRRPSDIPLRSLFLYVRIILIVYCIWQTIGTHIGM